MLALGRKDRLLAGDEVVGYSGRNVARKLALGRHRGMFRHCPCRAHLLMHFRVQAQRATSLEAGETVLQMSPAHRRESVFRWSSHFIAEMQSGK